MHISDSTLSYLEGAYEVEPGGGEERSSTLKDYNVKTYFIKPKEAPSSARKQVRSLNGWRISDKQADKAGCIRKCCRHSTLNEQTLFETLYTPASLYLFALLV